MKSHRLSDSTSVLALAAVLSLSTTASFAHQRAQTPKPGWGLSHHVGAWDAPYQAPENASLGTWVEAPKFPGSFPETSLLMTNGTVITHDQCTSNWYRLSPDSHGDYNTGKWTRIASMPAGYTPLYFASQVLKNGNVIVNGGEYNTNCAEDHTTMGAWYNAAANKWVSVNPPSGWSTIGDAVSVVLNTGQYMLSNCCTTQQALATISNVGAVTWAATGTNKTDNNNEEGWTLLSTGKILSVDIWSNPGGISPAELYSPTTGKWSATGTTTNVMADPNSFELGPALRLPNGTVFQIGTNPCASTTCSSHTSIYQVSTGTWTAGPDELQVGGNYYTTEDAPAVVLPDGHVLSQQSPSYNCGGSPLSPFCSPSHFFDYNPSTKAWTQVSDPVSGQAASDGSYEGRFLPLPNGTILWTSDQGDVEVYKPTGAPSTAWRPTITSAPTILTLGQKTVDLTGTLFAGVADGAKYGDDAQMAENYPIVRIANTASGTVCFGTTTSSSATHATFNMPATGCTTGASQLEVVTNGIASTAVAVTVN